MDATLAGITAGEQLPAFTWLNERGRILRMQCRFRAVNNKGQQVTARGRVTSVERQTDGLVVELDVWTEDQDGNQLAPGNCTVLIDC